MREPLVIAVAQPPCVRYEVGVNAVTHAAVVRSAGARVVVFPELSLTGCSGIWSPEGVVVAQVGPETGAIARATLG